LHACDARSVGRQEEDVMQLAGAPVVHGSLIRQGSEYRTSDRDRARAFHDSAVPLRALQHQAWRQYRSRRVDPERGDGRNAAHGARLQSADFDRRIAPDWTASFRPELPNIASWRSARRADRAVAEVLD